MWMAGNKQTAMSQTSETTQPPQQPFPWLSLCVQIQNRSVTNSRVQLAFNNRCVAVRRKEYQ